MGTPPPTGAPAEKQKLNVYLLPGIGLSVHYFDSLIFPASCRVTAIPLPQPLEGETISGYAGRLMENVEQDILFLLIGMSFGGVLAQAMAAIRQPAAIIILSSIRHCKELPWYFRLGHSAKLTRHVPYHLIEKGIRLVRATAGEKNRLLYDNRTTSAGYLAWSLDKMLSWQPSLSPVLFFQVHGAEDRLLPCRYKKDMLIIPKASHLLLPKNCREVNRITSGILEALPAHR